MSDDIEMKAQLLGFALAKGSRRGAGYELRDAEGKVMLGEGNAASLKQVDKFLDDRVRDMAKALGFRLTTAKERGTDALSSGEMRAAQQAARGGYKLEQKEIVTDQGRREETDKERDERARSGGQKTIWVTVLGEDSAGLGGDFNTMQGGDFSATLHDVIEYLKEHKADVGIDDDDIEVDVNKHLKKVAAPSVQKMSASLKGHDNAAAIRDRGFGNSLGENKPTKEEADLRRALDALDQSYYGHLRAVEKLNPAEWEEYLGVQRKRAAMQARYEALVRQLKGHDKPVDVDPVMREKRRSEGVKRDAELKLARTSTLSQWDPVTDAFGHVSYPGQNRQLDWNDKHMVPDSEPPDVRAVTTSSGFTKISKADAGKRNGSAAPSASVAGLKEAARQRRLREAGKKIKALLTIRDYAGAALLLEQAKKDAGHGNFLPWLDQVGIDVQVAQRCMRRQPNTSPKIKSSQC
jgi:hypothetical protein